MTLRGRCGSRHSSSPRAVCSPASRRHSSTDRSRLRRPQSPARLSMSRSSVWHGAHAGTAAQRAHARGCRVRVRGARSRSDADVEAAARNRGSVRRRALGAGCGEPHDRSGAAQRVVADLRHGHRGHVGPGRRRRAVDGSGSWLRSAAHQHHRPRCPHRLHHHRRCDCGDPRAIDDVGCPRARSRRLRRRHDVPQLRRARPRDDAVLGGDPHRAHLRARLSGISADSASCRRGSFASATG